MFYSRELLARKASLGQIWLLGTKQAKLDRRKANKLDVARLCEEILNPPVPMALRLTSILMGGVVILYEKKVVMLHDDANRLLIDLRNAWKEINEATLLPKNKAKAGRRSITLPDFEDTNLGEPEDEEIPMGFQQNNFNMRLDQIDDYYVFLDPMADNLTHDHNQADDNDITLCDSFQPTTEFRNQFERFEEGGEETQQNTFEEHIEMPTAPIPSPGQENGPQRGEDIPEQHPEDLFMQQDQFDQQPNLNKAARDQQRQGPVKRKARSKRIVIEEPTIISSAEMQSRLKDTSDILKRKLSRQRRCTNMLSTSKIPKLMELPSTVLMDDIFMKGNQEIPYPPQLLELWKNSTQPDHDSPTARTSQPQPPEPEEFPSERMHDDYPMNYSFDDHHSGVGSSSIKDIELQRTSMRNNTTVTPPVELVTQFVTPRNSGDAPRYSGSSASGDGVLAHMFEVNTGRVGSRNSRNSTGGLEPVVEVHPFQETDTIFKLSKSQNLTPEFELLVETQLTMETPQNDPPDIMTENMRMHMKTHFETPGAPQVESLNNLAAGLNRKGAAQLFYQTCVLASLQVLKVEQTEPFGDILISRGAKM